MLKSGSGIPLSETIIILAETVVIKLASKFDSCQGNNFDGLKWQYALLTVAIGNGFSYAAGLVILT